MRPSSSPPCDGVGYRLSTNITPAPTTNDTPGMVTSLSNPPHSAHYSIFTATVSYLTSAVFTYRRVAQFLLNGIPSGSATIIDSIASSPVSLLEAGTCIFTYNTASFTLNPRSTTIPTNPETKLCGPSDQPLTYRITLAVIAAPYPGCGGKVQAANRGPVSPKYIPAHTASLMGGKFHRTANLNRWI